MLAKIFFLVFRGFRGFSIKVFPGVMVYVVKGDNIQAIRHLKNQRSYIEIKSTFYGYGEVFWVLFLYTKFRVFLQFLFQSGISS